jgi:hypothetical protein
MGHDRIIRFEKGPPPTKEEIEKVVRNFLGGIEEKIYWENNTLFVVLPGKGTPALLGFSDIPADMHDSERYFEIWNGDPNYINIETRHADDFTNVLCERLGYIFSTWWEGKWEGREIT